MTETRKLIKELRSNAAVYKGFLEADGIRLTRGIALQARAADALEALTARAEAAEAENESLRRFDWLKRNRAVEDERDALAARIAALSDAATDWGTHIRIPDADWNRILKGES